MSIARAKQIVSRSSQSAGFNSAAREMLNEVIDELAQAINTSGITVLAGTNAEVPEGGGVVVVTVDQNGNEYTVNLSLGE